MGSGTGVEVVFGWGISEGIGMEIVQVVIKIVVEWVI
jgi:hypothetical protein